MSDDHSRKKAPSLRFMNNLFVGEHILNQLIEFCKELNKVATRARLRANVQNIV